MVLSAAKTRNNISIINVLDGDLASIISNWVGGNIKPTH